MAEFQAGWYADPSGDMSKLRYWDGNQWTENYTDISVSVEPSNNGMAIGLGVAAMVIGVVAIVISFIPLINILGILLAVVGLILGIISIVMSRNGRASIGFGIAGVVMSLISLAITVAMYVSFASWFTSENGLEREIESAIQQLEAIPDEVFQNETLREEIENAIEQLEDSVAEGAGQYDSYQEIYDEYSKRMRQAADELIDEYDAEVGNLDGSPEDEVRLRVEKFEKLLPITTEGVAAMAYYMRNNGGRLDEYREWTTKLYKVYGDEVQRITDATNSIR